MVDGKDRDSQVKIDINVRASSAGLDFGFMSNGLFSSLVGDCCRTADAVFVGGHDNRFRRAESGCRQPSDSAHYADQYCSGWVKSSNRNSEMSDSYYSSLAMIWDLDQDGIREIKATLNSRKFFDGMQLVPAPLPVPLPATTWLFGSGLVGLALLARRRKARI